MLLGLSRGSGARSLSGMPVRRGPLRPSAARPARGRRRSLPARPTASSPWHDPHNATTRSAGSALAGCSRRSRPTSARALQQRWPALPTCCARTPTTSRAWRSGPGLTCPPAPGDPGVDLEALAALPAGDPHPRVAHPRRRGRGSPRRCQRGARRVSRRVAHLVARSGPAARARAASPSLAPVPPSASARSARRPTRLTAGVHAPVGSCVLEAAMTTTSTHALPARVAWARAQRHTAWG